MTISSVSSSRSCAPVIVALAHPSVSLKANSQASSPFKCASIVAVSSRVLLQVLRWTSSPFVLRCSRWQAVLGPFLSLRGYHSRAIRPDGLDVSVPLSSTGLPIGGEDRSGIRYWPWYLHVDVEAETSHPTFVVTHRNRISKQTVLMECFPGNAPVTTGLSGSGTG